MPDIETLCNKIHRSDCHEFLKAMPDDSVDAIITDPPYGLGSKDPTGEEIDAYLQGKNLDTGGDFMGKAWEIPSVPVWRECLRVLKPGHHVLAFSSTRTWDIMMAGMLEAGFIAEGSLAEKFGTPLLQWIHGQGFPKSLDVAKAIDKLLLSGKQDDDEAEAETDDASAEADGEARTASSSQLVTDEAKKWKGWGTALKPAWEPIIALRKPGPVLDLPEILVPFKYCSKVTKSEADEGLEKAPGSDDPKTNTHPTRKPLALMQWLIEIASKPEWSVLDPYCGSGTTCIAAVKAAGGLRKFIGIERELEYHRIAECRIKGVYEFVHGNQSQADLFADIMNNC